MMHLFSIHAAASGSYGSGAACRGRDGGREKLVDDWCEFPRTRPQSQVSIVEDVKLCTRDQALHDLRVDQWDERVVIAMENQGRLPECVEPGDAGPTHCSQHLIEVAKYAAQARGTGALVRQLGLCAHLPPVDVSAVLPHIDRVLVATGPGNLRQS